MEPRADEDQLSQRMGIVEEFVAHEIRRHPEQLAISLMSAPNVGVSICDLQFRFRSINDTLAAINGVPVRAHFGQSIHDILGDVAGKVDPLFRHVVATGEPILNVHLTGLLPTRKEPGHWIENYFPLKDGRGRVNRLCSMVVEVTEQKKLEESLRLLNSLGKDDTDQLRVLAEFHSRLVARPSFGELTGAITTYVNRLIPHDYAMLTLEDETARWLGVDATESAGSRIVSASGGLAPLVGGPEFADLPSTNDEPGGKLASWNQMRGPDIQSVYNMPLITKGLAIGTLHLASRQRGAFERLNRELVERVAMHVALALDYARTSKENESLKRKFADEKVYVEEAQEREEEFREILGESPALRQVLKQAKTVAQTDATVLILGETGTGKELMARAIHSMGRRSEQNFVKINCTAISSGLLESELFGHEKGAFTEALIQKMGRLERADGGTLLLDEIGDLPLELQPKLLRVLQDGEFERLGSTRTMPVNVRFMAVTNQDLPKKVAEGSFRSDLFYRLNVFSIRMPALRERREDIPELVRHFVHKFSHQTAKHVEVIPNELLKGLQQWDWPGNVRELEHFVERSVIQTQGTVLRGSISELRQAGTGCVERTLQMVERDYILQVLRETGGKVAGLHGAAAKLGLKRTTLQSRMQKLKIHRSEYGIDGKRSRRSGPS